MFPSSCRTRRASPCQRPPLTKETHPARGEKWYQAALSQQAGKILANGQEFDVLFAKPSDPELESKIDQAYQKKYSSSNYVSVMTGTRARAATIEILPLS